MASKFTDSVKKIALVDVKNLYEYEKIRDRFRREIIELKKRRRVSVGDKITLIFENRETVLFQIQEMIRAEQIVADDKIREEIDVYNELLPAPGQLSATLLIEIEDRSKIKEELDRFLGIDEGERVYFQIGREHAVAGLFETGHSKADKISAVHFVRFSLTPDEIAAFQREGVVLVVDHPNYRARVTLSSEIKATLLEDFTDGSDPAASSES